jgi:hypothetical protein
LRLSVIVATLGRKGLEQAIWSIVSQRYPEDETLIVSCNPDVAPLAKKHQCRFVLTDRPGDNWGDTERLVGMPLATGDYVAFMDDDDIYTDGAREAIEKAAEENPKRPLLFRLKFEGSNVVLWDRKSIEIGNVGTPCLVAPNDPARLGRWGCRKNKDRGGDFDYVSSMKWPLEDVVWVPHVIAHIGVTTQ